VDRVTSETFQTRSEEETIALGAALAGRFPHKAVVLLIGELGAGKTTLAKGIAQGLGAARPEEVASPTFTLIHEFGQGPALYHVDFYRLESPGEVIALGFDEILDRDAVVLIEWGERFPELMPARRVEIRIDAQADDSRKFTVTALGE
jgi:tRNA threonylcarbamoyladenosine biosynthesis protein TsaE